MSLQSKREYIEAVYLRYKKAHRTQKFHILDKLDEFCATLGYHRKHAIHLLRYYKRFSRPKPKKGGPKPFYKPEAILEPLKKIYAIKANSINTCMVV